MSAGAEKQYLSFELAGFPVLCDVRQIEEVLEPRAVQPVGRSRPWFLGVAIYQGQFVPVTDLSRWYRDQSGLRESGRVSDASSASGSRWLIVGHASDRFALAVDRVEEISALPQPRAAGGRQAPDPIDSKPDHPHAGPGGGALIPICADQMLLDTEALVTSPDFLNIADNGHKEVAS